MDVLHEVLMLAAAGLIAAFIGSLKFLFEWVRELPPAMKSALVFVVAGGIWAGASAINADLDLSAAPVTAILAMGIREVALALKESLTPAEGAGD